MKKINTVFYIISLNDYNTLLYEDDKTNCLKESLELFEKTVNSDEAKNQKIDFHIIFNKGIY
jgi:hypothetical protein